MKKVIFLILICLQFNISAQTITHSLNADNISVEEILSYICDSLQKEFTILPNCIVIHDEGKFHNFPIYYKLTESQSEIITQRKEEKSLASFFKTIGIEFDDNTSAFYFQEKKLLIFSGSRNEKRIVSNLLREYDKERRGIEFAFKPKFLSRKIKSVNFDDLNLNQSLDALQKCYTNQFPQLPPLPFLFLKEKATIQLNEPDPEDPFSEEVSVTKPIVQPIEKHSVNIKNLALKDLIWYTRLIISKEAETFFSSVKSYQVDPQISSLIVENTKNKTLRELFLSLGLSVKVEGLDFIEKYDRVVLLGDQTAHYVFQFCLERLNAIYGISTKRVIPIGQSSILNEQVDMKFQELDVYEITDYTYKVSSKVFKKKKSDGSDPFILKLFK